MNRISRNKPKSCKEILPLLGEFWRDKLDIVETERVRTHLKGCKVCEEKLSEHIATAFVLGEISIPKQLAELQPPREALEGFVAAHLEANRARHPSKGSVWTKLQPLAAEGVLWAKEEIDRVRSALQGLMQVLSPLQVQWEAMGFRTMGGTQAAWPEDVPVKVVDPSGKPQERSVHFKVVKPPTVTQAGDFLLIMHTDEAGLEGRKLLCTVTAVEGEKVTFESELLEDAAAVPALMAALKDEDDLVRREAAAVLKQIGDASAVPALIETLKDEDVAIRQAAAEALGRIGGPSAVPGLVGILKDKGVDQGIRQAAIETLREAGKPRWWAIIRAEGLPACEKDVVIPYDQVWLSLQGD